MNITEVIMFSCFIYNTKFNSCNKTNYIFIQKYKVIRFVMFHTMK